MKPTTIFVRDTFGDTTRLLRRFLPRDYKVLRVETLAGIIERMKHQAPDLLCLDPASLDICVWLRERQHALPIVILGSSREMQEVVRALDMGADDYVTTPFSLAELAARIRALIRRSQGTVLQQGILQSRDGHVCLHADSRQVFIREQRVPFTKTELALLHYLMSHADSVVTNRTLLETVWGPQYAGEVDYVRIYVRQIRCKIEPDPSHPIYIQTVSGVGYVFVREPVKETRSPQPKRTQQKV